MIKLILLLPFLLFMSCSSKNSTALGQETEHPQEIPDTIVDAKLLSLYFDAKNTSKATTLNTAIVLADSMIDAHKDNDKVHIKYILQKILFLTLYNEMESAIEALKGDSCNMWEIMGGPYFKTILEHRILAMSAKNINDQQLYEANIMEALKLVEKYISDNKDEYVLFLKNDLQHQRGKYIITTQEYIYYSYLLYGKERTDKILEEYQDLYHISDSVIEQLKQLYYRDIMDFDLL